MSDRELSPLSDEAPGGFSNGNGKRSERLRVCIAGLGGFAAAHHAAIQMLEAEGRVRLVATCDPRHQDLIDEVGRFGFAQRQVAVFADFEEMLEEYSSQCDLVTIATPIALHRSMHAACVKRDLACYLEKPPTLDPFELECMIEQDREAVYQTQVGFSHTVEPWRQVLKQRLIGGEFGDVEMSSFLGAWQRDERYYNRAPWAGKISLKGRLVLDSCFGNAMSHHAHSALFFAAKKGVFSWATIENVQAEMYRANSIECADTVFSEAVSTDGVHVRVAMSHASASAHLSEEVIVCRDARIHISPQSEAKIHHSDGRIEAIDMGRSRNNLLENFRHFVDYLKGRKARPVTTLQDSRPFVSWNALNYIAAGAIRTIPATYRELTDSNRGESKAWVVPGIENALREFLTHGTFPSKTSTPWAARGGTASLDDLGRLSSTVARIAGVENSPRSVQTPAAQ